VPAAAAGREIRQVWISLSDLRPAPENDKLYGPVNPGDPEVVNLAVSIRDYGLKEPFHVTTDGYIISGHRRFVACKLAGVAEVPAFVEPITHDDPRFLVLLRENNRQRVKTAAQVLREEIISSNPEDAHRELQEHRKKTGKAPKVGTGVVIEIAGTKHRAKISEGKHAMLDAVIDILNDRADYWPLTVRQIHYPLLNDPPLRHSKKPDSRYKNDRKSYQDLCDLLLRARFEGIIPWHVIADPTRTVQTWNLHQHVGAFVREELDLFLNSYRRDLQQSQPYHLEILGEKNTVGNILAPVAEEYCVPMSLGRGYCSGPPRYEMVERFKKSGKEHLVALIVSDLDLDGDDIAESFARSLRDELGVGKDRLTAVKVALTYDQVTERGLPPGGKVKANSPSRKTRAKRYVAKYGTDDVWELEALPPDELQELLRGAVEGYLDREAFDAEVEKEKQDAAEIKGMRRAFQKIMLESGEPGSGGE
jgi:hypothetical protein